MFAHALPSAWEGLHFQAPFPGAHLQAALPEQPSPTSDLQPGQVPKADSQGHLGLLVSMTISWLLGPNAQPQLQEDKPTPD